MPDTDTLKAECSRDDKFHQSDNVIYTLAMPGDLFEQVTRHVQLMRAVNGTRLSRTDWLQDCIKEHLKTKADIEEIVANRIRNFRIPISKKDLRELDKRVSLIRKLNGSYNKKMWIICAIEKKLLREKATLSKKISESPLSIGKE